MPDKPIIFSAPMIRALLDGRKTQTRRVLNPQPEQNSAGLWVYPPSTTKTTKRNWRGFCQTDEDGLASFILSTPHAPYAPKERLWVREAWKPGAWREDGRAAIDYKASPELVNTPWLVVPENVWEDLWIRWSDELLATGSVPDADGMHHWEPGESPMRWRSPIHMPRWASRMTLGVTEVRVQRLQEISEADARAEGAAPWTGAEQSYRTDFAKIWRTIHGPDAWDANPWVCALTLNVHRCNIDQMER